MGKARTKTRATEPEIDSAVGPDAAEMPIREDSVLDFAAGLIGFESHRRFALLTADEMKPFHWLMSVDDPQIAFMMVDPFLVDGAYDPAIDDEALESVGASDPSEIVVFAIATFNPGTNEITVNLKAPVILNPTARSGAQVHLHQAGYGTHHRITESAAANQELHAAA